MICSLKIRYADVEVEFTGEETFAEKHLLPLIQALSKALEIGDAGAVSKTPIEKRALKPIPYNTHNFHSRDKARFQDWNRPCDSSSLRSAFIRQRYFHA